MFVIGSDVELRDLQIILFYLQFAFTSTTFEQGLRHVYKWQFNIYLSEPQSQAAALMRPSLCRPHERQQRDN